MNDPPEDPPLERLLDQAGASAQPTHSGWSRLSERLGAARREPPRPSRLWWAAVPVGLAAAAVVWLVLLGGDPDIVPVNRVEAKDEPIRVERKDVEVTILSVADTTGETLYMPLLQRLGSGIPVPDPTQAFTQMIVWREVGDGRWLPHTSGGRQGTGQALVKDHRMILNLKEGDNVVRFSDVAASIDPTSVRFASKTDPDGTTVVEQNFEYDLASADTLLKRFVDQEITCVGRDGIETKGYLASIDDANIVLASEPTPPPDQPKKARSTQTVSRDGVQAVRLPTMPSGLLTKPTLVWKLRARTPGKHDTTVSYLCGMVQWNADYVAVVEPGKDGRPDRLDLTGWVSIENRSGATYDQAGLKLIAGDVNRVRDPWAVIPPRRPALDEWMYEREETATADYKADPKKKEFVEQSFFEYHLYALSAPSTVRDRQIKQLNLLKKDGIQADRRYLVHVLHNYGNQKVPVQIELTAKNAKDNQLGMPLPKGRVTLQQRDADGEFALLGRAEIDHVAKDEELHFVYGNAFDVAADTKNVKHEQLGDRHYRRQNEMRVRNHKPTPVRVRVAVFLGANWEVTQESMPHTKHDYQTIHYDFDLAPDAERVIQTTVDYRW